MKNNATHTIRSEEITIDVRICAALAANRGGEIYLAAIAPDMELTVITLDEAPGILPCFDEDDACLNLPNTSLLLCYNPAQVLKVQAGIVLLKAGQDVGSLVQRDDGQFHIRGNGCEVDLTAPVCRQRSADTHINGDLFGADGTGSVVFHRLFSF